MKENEARKDKRMEVPGVNILIIKKEICFKDYGVSLTYN